MFEGEKEEQSFVIEQQVIDEMERMRYQSCQRVHGLSKEMRALISVITRCPCAFSLLRADEPIKFADGTLMSERFKKE